MKSHLIQLVSEAASSTLKQGIAREYLQAIILQSLQQSGSMASIAFHGGTSLRFLFALPRFSEDLDFSLETNFQNYDFQKLINRIKWDLEKQGYSVTVKGNDHKIVNSAFFRFQGLVYEAGLSNQPDEVLAIKLEIDTNPPKGTQTTTTVIQRHVLLNIHHHDKASLFSGIVHTVLQSPCSKGRDLYDLLWYLSNPEWPEPNLTMLNNALVQSHWHGQELTSDNWRTFLMEKLPELNWSAIQQDVRSFIINSQELELLKLEVFQDLLSC